MSVIAAMWSQSIPWRNPKRNAVIRNPRPNASDDAVSTPLPPGGDPGPIEPYLCSSRQLQLIARRWMAFGSEDRGLAPGTEDRLQRLGDLSLGAPRSRAVDQRHHQVGLGLPSNDDERRERGARDRSVPVGPGPLDGT